MSRRLPLLFVTGAVCLGLAACGSDDDDPPARAEATTTQSATPDSGAADPGTAAPGASGEDADAGTTSDTAPPASDDGAGSGGGKNSKEEAKVRDALLALQEATAAKDGKKACSLTIGIPKKADPKNPGLSCESLSQGPKTQLSEQHRKAVAAATVTVDGTNAVMSLGGMPMKLRKVDGRWRVDYTNVVSPGASSR